MANASFFESFRGLEKELEKEHSVRDKVRDAVRELESTERELTVILQSIHRHADEAQLKQVCDQCDALIDSQLRSKIGRLAETIPEGEYYRFSDHFRNTAQRIVYVCAITHFLRSGTLVTRDQVDTRLGVRDGHVHVANSDLKSDAEVSAEQSGQTARGSARFVIDLEDFLNGLLILSNELGRFAVNAVTSGDFERPTKIAQLLADLDAGFRLLTLKNDALRRRYDSLKYDLKKVEEVVYDVSIRRLAQK